METAKKQETNEQWIRLKQVVDMTGMSTNRFAAHIGLKHTETLYRIKRGLNGISKSMADRIVSYYPEISKGWLLTGEGYMFND